VRQFVEILRQAGDGGKASHHQKQRQGRDLAIGQKPGAFGGEGREEWWEPDEQRAAHNPDQPGDRGQRNLAEHQDPHAGERDTHRLAWIVLRPCCHAGEIEHRIAGQHHNDDREQDGNGGCDRIRLCPGRLDISDSLPDLVERDDGLHDGADRQQRHNDVHERRHWPAQQHGGAALRVERA
jgi:hypothetical protein